MQSCFFGLQCMNQFKKKYPKPVHAIDPKCLFVKLLLQKGLYISSVSDYDVLNSYTY